MENEADIQEAASKAGAQLLISWEQRVQSDSSLKEVSLTKIKTMLYKYKFLENKIDESIVSIISSMLLQPNSPPSIKKSSTIRSEALKLFDLLNEAKNIFDQMPLSQHKQYLDQIPSWHPLAIPNHIHGDMNLVFLPENTHLVKLLIDNTSHISTVLEVLIKVSRSTLLEFREIPGGRPRRNSSLENLIGNLYSCWYIGTGKLPDLSQNRLRFLAFCIELGCGPPHNFTDAEVKGAVRSVLAEAKKQTIDQRLMLIAQRFQEPPHNLEPEHAKAAAQEIISKLGLNRKRKREPEISDKSSA